MIDFEPLGALLGLGAPKSDLASFGIQVLFIFSRKPCNSLVKSTISHRNLIIPCWIEQSVTETLQFLAKMNHRFTETLLLQRGSHLWMPWPRSELTIQASNEFGLDLKVPCSQLLVMKRFIRVTENEVRYLGRWTHRAAPVYISSKIILATKQDRAIDLSCRACGAGAWALGLDSRWGPPLRSVLHPQPPIEM